MDKIEPRLINPVGAGSPASDHDGAVLSDRAACGVAIQSAVTGCEAPEAQTPLSESWRDFVYAEVWSRPALDRRARYLIAIAGAAMAGAEPDILDGYVRGSLSEGYLSLAELREGALHMAVYGGWARGERVERSIDRVALSLELSSARPAAAPVAPLDMQTRMENGAAEFADVMLHGSGAPATPYLAAIGSFVFAEMWSRRGLDQRSRRFLTLVAVAEASCEIPIKTHFHAAMASGNCTPDEIQEFVLQYGVFAGWPKASLVQGLVFEMIGKFEAGLPWNG